MATKFVKVATVRYKFDNHLYSLRCFENEVDEWKRRLERDGATNVKVLHVKDVPVQTFDREVKNG